MLVLTTDSSGKRVGQSSKERTNFGIFAAIYKGSFFWNRTTTAVSKGNPLKLATFLCRRDYRKIWHDFCPLIPYNRAILRRDDLWLYNLFDAKPVVSLRFLAELPASSAVQKHRQKSCRLGMLGRTHKPALAEPLRIMFSESGSPDPKAKSSLLVAQ